MKVFYVVVLVLVAGAVTSYGRTESEGTVFNKTQIHESMNNGTESSSKFVPNFQFYFVMQWPGSFCYLYPCLQQFSYFTVHGLWPMTRDCIGRCQPHMRFGHVPLAPSLLPDLNKYWPNLRTRVVDNNVFWEYEYNKHGCCTFNNQNEYFYRSLVLVGRLGHLASKLSQVGGGLSILPGSRHKIEVFKRAVHAVTFVWPRLICDWSNNPPLLLEIRFCATPCGINDICLTDCNPYTNCGNGDVYFP